MYGNLSKTIVSVPNAFNISAHLTGLTLYDNKYKHQTINGTFSYLNKIKLRANNGYFKLSEHFKENSPYMDLNFNNNRRYISPLVTKPSINLNDLLFPKNINNNQKIRKSISQSQLISKASSLNVSKIMDKEITKEANADNNVHPIINIIDNTTKDNINNKQEINLSETKNTLTKINEFLPIEENTKNNNTINEENYSKNSEEEEKSRQENYFKKLEENKPHNLAQLKKFLEIKYIDDSKKINFLPKIRRVTESISQDDLFKQTLISKLASLRMIKPKVKEGIFKRKKNMIMKRDYDLIKRIYNVRKTLPYYLRNIISYEALAQQ